MAWSWSCLGKVDNPVATALQQESGYQVLMKGLLVPKFLVGLLGLVAGIGVIKGRDAARKAGVIWALVYLVLGAAETAGNVYFTRAAVATMQMPPAVKPEMIAGVRAGLMNTTLIGAAFALVFVLALAIMMVVQLTRRECVEFCTAKPFN